MKNNRHHKRNMKHRKLNSKRSTPESQVEYVDEEFDAIKLDVTHSESLSDSDDNNENDSDDNPQSSNMVMNVKRIGNEQSIMKCCSNDDDNLKAECGEMNQQAQPSLDFAVEPCFEDENPSYQKDNDTNNQNQNELFTTFKSKLKRISQKVFHCICPLARPCAALIRCDMQTFWNILPSIVVIKALWLSYLCMVFCDLAKVVRLIPTEVQSNNGPIHVFQKEQYSFGLWAYSKTVHEDYTVDGFVKNEVERVETCELNMKSADDGSPDQLFLLDVYFILARTFAILTATIGSISMIVLWLSSARVQKLNTPFTRKLIGVGLLTCCLCQASVLLFFASKVCRDTQYGEDRHCGLEEGSGTIFGGCLFWLLTGIAMMKMTPPTETTTTTNNLSSSDEPQNMDHHSSHLGVHQSEVA